METDFYLELIHQDLRGELTADGKKQLADWRKADPDNVTLENEVRKSWKLTEGYAPDLPLDTTAAYDRLRTRVRAHEAKAKSATVRQLKPKWNTASWLAVAAAVLLVVVSGWWLLDGTSAAGPMATVVTAADEAPRLVVLPDGSQVWLREASSLTYPEPFAGDVREVSLTGEAFFEVTENAAVPFRIALPGRAIVEVLGTEFLVAARDSQARVVTVRSGQVALDVGNKRLLLPAGKAGRYDPATQALTAADYRPNAAAWHDNTLTFDDVALPEVLVDLEDYFGVEIMVTNEALRDCRFGGRFPNADLEAILDAMKTSFGLTWLPDGTTYVLAEGDCG